MSQAAKKAMAKKTNVATSVHKPATTPMAQAWPRTAWERTSDTSAEKAVRPSNQRIEKRGISIEPIVAEGGGVANET